LRKYSKISQVLFLDDRFSNIKKNIGFE